ncbi:hypothetical protein PVIIG_05827 [Plasmodium vivax India VII]|uniref:PIR Superfamily Protein n=1 Tax=Plasmodium vivax India VII TaxID=1077284 RepID=A0A0J9S2E0_PLAVI|nr:hypothetical protein PVIIG_05827 [Plasmodium vivax India VII]
MTREENIEAESYDFFDNVVNYIEKAKSNVGPSNYESKCKSFMQTSGHYITDKETGKNICEQFIKLYYSLKDYDKCISNSRPDKLCSNFLNYWINSKLRKIMKGEDNCVSHVYDLLESQFTADEDFNINIDNKYIYNINEDDLHKMNILYSLYEKYTDISAMLENTTSRDKELLLSLSNASCKVYHEANYMYMQTKKKYNPLKGPSENINKINIYIYNLWVSHYYTNKMDN